MAASTSDMAIIANQYKISNNNGKNELVSSKVTPPYMHNLRLRILYVKKGYFAKREQVPRKEAQASDNHPRKLAPL